MARIPAGDACLSATRTPSVPGRWSWRDRARSQQQGADRVALHPRRQERADKGDRPDDRREHTWNPRSASSGGKSMFAPTNTNIACAATTHGHLRRGTGAGQASGRRRTGSRKVVHGTRGSARHRPQNVTGRSRGQPVVLACIDRSTRRAISAVAAARTGPPLGFQRLMASAGPPPTYVPRRVSTVSITLPRPGGWSRRGPSSGLAQLHDDGPRGVEEVADEPADLDVGHLPDDRGPRVVEVARGAVERTRRACRGPSSRPMSTTLEQLRGRGDDGSAARVLADRLDRARPDVDPAPGEHRQHRGGRGPAAGVARHRAGPPS